jgi:hypothetical protein
MLGPWSDDYFAVRFTGNIIIHEAGDYSFKMRVDDISRFSIDG